MGAFHVVFFVPTGKTLTLTAGQITVSVDSGVALLALLVCKGAKLKNVGESIVVSQQVLLASGLQTWGLLSTSLVVGP